MPAVMHAPLFSTPPFSAPRLFAPRRRAHFWLALLWLVLLLPRGAAAGSAVNVDLHRGAPDPENAGTPSDAYAAASAQSGRWNGVTVLSFGPHALLDRNGAPGPSLTMASNAQAVGGRNHDNPSTSGDDQALLDDGFNIPDGRGSFVTLTVAGLAPNIYDVYTYAWDPAFTAAKSVTVDVNGTGAVPVAPPSDVFLGFVTGETHAQHTVVLGAGESLAITVVIGDGLFPAGVVNGFQIVPQGPEAVEAGTWGAIKARFHSSAGHER